MRPVRLSGPATKADQAYAADSLRAGRSPRSATTSSWPTGSPTADTANDKGGLTGDKLQTGYDPTNSGYYHGGDLKGIQQKLDYIKGLGTTSIWLTPSFKNRPVQGAPPNDSAGYHGYWITDFTQVDPHLGTNADLTALISAAHAKGMKVFFDIITNHTADVINYSEGQYTYRDKTTYPYKDAAGNVFDDKAYAGKPGFPALDPATSFPYHPVFNTPGRRDGEGAGLAQRPRRTTTTAVTRPSPVSPRSTATSSGSTTCSPSRPTSRRAWRTSTRRGSTSGSTASGSTRSSTSTWSSGRSSARRCSSRPSSDGNPDFFMFGEVYDSRPSYMSTFTTTGKLPGDAGLRVPGPVGQLGAGQVRHRPARPLRRRRLLHRHRLQRLRAADLPRQPRHGPGRDAAQGPERRRRRPDAPRQARRLADVPHPRPADHLLRRRAGLHGFRR